MVKSLEQYLSDLSFSPPEKGADARELSAGERIFVEKYLGMDALDKLPRVDPEPLMQLERPAPAPRPALTLIEQRVITPEIVVAPPRPQSAVEIPEVVKPPEVVVVQAPAGIGAAQKSSVEIEEDLREEIKTEAAAETAADLAEAAEAEAAPVAVAAKAESVPKAGEAAPARIAREETAEVPLEVSIKEDMKRQEEIQTVSFFVEGQLFLLPVAGIQEVLRHMELIRVPQAPAFVAGVINLRGKVTPLVHLSAILTNAEEHVYDPNKNFIIICGAEPLQVGLIIDRISGMHLLTQDKIIWNVESKLGEAADFLYAIVNLNDRVCGMVAPEMITRKILASDL